LEWKKGEKYKNQKPADIKWITAEITFRGRKTQGRKGEFETLVYFHSIKRIPPSGSLPFQIPAEGNKPMKDPNSSDRCSLFKLQSKHNDTLNFP